MRWILATLAIAWLIDITHAADVRNRNTPLGAASASISTSASATASAPASAPTSTSTSVATATPRVGVGLGLARSGAGTAGTDREREREGVEAFRDVASVLTSPRCLNCHVPGDAPLQGDDNHRHTMNVKRGPDGRGTPAMRCGNCHQAANTMTAHAPPGVEGWRLPPPAMRMAWQGLAPDALCRTLKDPRKTGGRTLAQLLDHVTHDHLVAWAWDPGPGRSVPPLSHEQFAARFRVWTEQGAPCPAASSAGAKEAR